MRSFYLLNGWAMSSAAVQPLVNALAPLGTVTVLSLPAYIQDSVENTLAHLEQSIPPQTHLIGWSLGGMLALQLAAQSNYGSVTCLGANLSFIATPLWPWAMSQADFERFYKRQFTHPDRTLQRFAQLCCQGANGTDVQPHSLVDPTYTSQHLMWGLDALAQLNNHCAIDQVRIPQLHLFAAHDALVPSQAQHQLQLRWPQVRSELIPGSHVFPVQYPEKVALAIQSFLGEQHV